MRILFFGSLDGTACSLHYYTNLVKLGHQVIPLDPAYFATRSPLERMALKISKQPSAKRRKLVAQRLIEVCRQSRFDVVFVMAENFLGADTILEVKANGADRPPVFLYHSHDNNFSGGILKPADFFETLKVYDHVSTTKSQNVARYREIGQPSSHYIPSAFEPSVHHPVQSGYSQYGNHDFPVTFIGTYDRSREAYLDKTGWDRLHVWGSHWTKSPNFRRYRERIQARPIYYFEFADVLTHSRLTLGLLRDEAGDLHTQRTFEIPACGALQIAPRNEEILSYFKEGEEIVCFGSLDELKEKVDYYLAHEDERKKIARRGFERCLRDRHTYADRVNEMLQIAVADSSFLRTVARSTR